MQTGYTLLLLSSLWAGEPSWSWLACHSKPLLHTRQRADGQPCRTHTAHKHNGPHKPTLQPYWVSCQLSALCTCYLWVVRCESVTNHVSHSWGMTGWLDIDASGAYCSTCEPGSSWRGIPSGALSCCRSTTRLSLRWKACIIKGEHDR